MRFTRRTLAELARALTKVSAKEELRTLAYELSLDDQFTGTTLKEQAGSLVRAAERLTPLEQAEAAIVRLVEYSFEYAGVRREDPLPQSLRVDGFEWDGSALVPTTPSPASLGPELTILEAKLQEYGFDVARRHYQQSYASFVDGRWEACNGQLRSFVENLFVQAGQRQTGQSRADPQAALGDLRGSLLDDSEWNLGRSLWSALHTAGAHAGLSERDESLFRLHIATAYARYLLSRLEAVPDRAV